MKTNMLRCGRPGVVAGFLFAISAIAYADEKTPIPSFTGQRVIVKDVPDRYGVIADQIARLEKSSPQSYYVVVIKAQGQGGSAHANTPTNCSTLGGDKDQERGRSFDPQRSVIVVVVAWTTISLLSWPARL